MTRSVPVLRVLFVAFFATLVSAAAFAVTNPASATLSPAHPTVTFTGGPFPVSNPSSPLGETPPACAQDTVCGEFALTISIPASDPNAYKARLSVGWTNSGTTTQGSATSDWGTSRRHAGLLLEDALNARIPQIWDMWLEDGVECRALNTEATEAAKEKLARLEAAFEAWIWTDPERADELARIYNDRFNNLVPRHFDGSHLQLPGPAA